MIVPTDRYKGVENVATVAKDEKMQLLTTVYAKNRFTLWDRNGAPFGTLQWLLRLTSM